MIHRYLEHFEVLAETSSISEASKVLHISQPALSRSLKILEDILETQLFIRKNRGIEITKYGKVLQKQVCSMNNEFQYAIREINHIKNETTRKLRIGSGLIWQFSIFPEAVKQYTTLYPEVRIDVTTGLSQTLYEEFWKGNYDIIFCDLSKLEYIEGVAHEHLVDVFFSFFASKKHPIFKKKNPQQKDLFLYDFAIFSHDNQIMSEERDEHRFADDLQRRVKYTSGSMINIMEVVSATNYLTSLPHYIQSVANSFGLKEIHPDMRKIAFPSGMVYRKSALEKKYFRSFIETTRKLQDER